MKIPKIIHQMWNTKEIPKEVIFCTESWNRLNPDWKYMFWTNESMDLFVKENFPDIYYTYNAYNLIIMKADLFRLLVLYKLGGVYADLDVECIQSLDYLLNNYVKNAELAFSMDPVIHSKRLFRRNVLYNNFFVISQPGSEILFGIIKAIIAKGSSHVIEEVIEVTGAITISDYIERGSFGDRDKLLDHKVVAPIVNVDSMIVPLRERGKSLKMILERKFFPETCVVHYWWHSWYAGKSALSLDRAALENRLREYQNPVNQVVDAIRFRFIQGSYFAKKHYRLFKKRRMSRKAGK